MGSHPVIHNGGFEPSKKQRKLDEPEHLESYVLPSGKSKFKSYDIYFKVRITSRITTKYVVDLGSEQATTLPPGTGKSFAEGAWDKVASTARTFDLNY